MIPLSSLLINTVQEQKKGPNELTHQEFGKSVDGYTSKIHTIVDGLRNPFYFKLSGGQVGDANLAIDTLKHVPLKNSNVIGERAHGSEPIRFYTHACTDTCTIPPKKNVRVPWNVDWWGAIRKDIWSNVFLINSNNSVIF